MAEPVVVVGGGISGLACAHRLVELDAEREVLVLEASWRTGGNLRTERTEDGFVIEHGPDSIITDKPWALDLARRVGLEEELVSTVPDNRGAYVVAHGRLEPIPEGFAMMAPMRIGPFLRSPILSWRGKLRAGLDVVVPRGSEDDESLASFVRRRFGDEVFERLAQPLVGGIYGADPEKLSLRATMPRFLDIEKESRSVSLGLLRRQRRASAKPGAKSHAASGARYGLFVSFREGCEALPTRLAEKLGGRVRTESAVTSLEPREGGWRVTAGGEGIDASAVVLAIPAHRAASLVEGWDADLAALLGTIPYGSAATATFAFRREQIPHPLDGYGFVVPSVEGRRILAATWSSRKWPGRAPAGMELVRVFLGGPGNEDVVERSDDAMVELSLAELHELMGVHGEPLLVRVDRYLRAMPHYHVGHAELVRRIDERVHGHRGLELAGNAYDGVGIPDSVRRGEAVAERLRA